MSKTSKQGETKTSKIDLEINLVSVEYLIIVQKQYLLQHKPEAEKSLTMKNSSSLTDKF